MIIGGGPYGLALAYVLRRFGHRAKVFGRPMELWLEHMPEGMFLKSEGRASSIVASDPDVSLCRFCAETGRPYADVGLPIPVETFAAYGRWFQDHVVPEASHARIARLSRSSRGFELTLETGEELEAGQVVVATGLRDFAFTSATVGRLPPHLVSHTAEHRSLQRFSASNVAVVGGGQSALEAAALIAETGGSATVIARARTLVWNRIPPAANRSSLARLLRPDSPLGAAWPLWAYSRATRAFSLLPETTRRRRARGALGPAGAWWLRPRVDGVVEILTEHRISAAAPTDDGRVQLVLGNGRDRQRRVFDHVVAATGYRVDVNRMQLLSAELRQAIGLSGQAPALTRSLESTVPGLFFTGMTAMNRCGPVMRFVCGAEVAARRIAAQLA